ncbi:MAG: TetR/AcrR family transcriptional regulator [Ignavibacteriaceae bacterium]
MANERKIQIIKAAAKRFARHGLNKTTLDEVARDIRIGKATIYHYFPSKDDLYIETLKWEIELFLEQVKSVFNEDVKPAIEKLLEYFSLKNEVSENYKLIYETLLNFYNDKSLEKENEQIKFLLNKEEDLVKKLLNMAYKEKVVSISPALPNLLVMYSWGILFGSKLNSLTNSSKINATKTLILKSLESLLS